MSSQPLTSAPSRRFSFEEADDQAGNYQQQQQQPIITPQSQLDRGLTVRKSIIHERSNYGFAPSPEPVENPPDPRASPYLGGGNGGHGGQYHNDTEEGAGYYHHQGPQKYNPVPTGRSYSPGYQQQQFQPSHQYRSSPVPRGMSGEEGGGGAKPPVHPMAHPSSAFADIQAKRRSITGGGGTASPKRNSWNQQQQAGYSGEGGAYPPYEHHQYIDSGVPPPLPPPHQPYASYDRPNSSGSNNSRGPPAGFGLTGAAAGRLESQDAHPSSHDQQVYGTSTPQGGYYPQQQSSELPEDTSYSQAGTNRDDRDYGAQSQPLMMAPPPAAMITTQPMHGSSPGGGGLQPYHNGLHPSDPPGSYIHNRSSNSSFKNVKHDVGGHYTDNPYNRYSTTWDPALSTAAGSNSALGLDGQVDVVSDDEEEVRRKERHAPGVLGALGAVVGKRASGNVRDAVGAGAGSEPRGSNLGLLGGGAAVGSSSAVGAPGGGGGGGSLSGMGGEKAMESDWLRSQKKSKKRTKWIALIILIIILIAAGGGGAAGYLLTRKDNNSGSSKSSGSGRTNNKPPTADIKSKLAPEVQAVMNNPDLRKIFHGIDYTPNNAIFPECIANPASQDEIIIDIAIMSQLTDKIRLYGTDCDQIEMVLNAIEILEVDMKIWLGVWLDGNSTTNARGLSHMYKLLDENPADRFEGVVVGNEVLFREELLQSQLVNILTEVKSNLTALEIDLPVATSDLGSNWDITLAGAVDVLMANVHPFFASVLVEDASDWTITYFERENAAIADAAPNTPRKMISEVGWPTGGGKKGGSVAGVEELNTFMEDFICEQNRAGTEYFWFSAFDEPWKEKFNRPELGEEWEDKWGLLDSKRNLKKGVKIPEC